MFGIDDLLAAKFLVPAGLAAIGAVKGKLSSDSANDQRREDQRLNAVKAATMPWLGIAPGAVTPGQNALGESLGDATQGALSGVAFNQNMDRSELEDALLKARTANAEKGVVSVEDLIAASKRA